jgi:hypothetical protein
MADKGSCKNNYSAAEHHVTAQTVVQTWLIHSTTNAKCPWIHYNDIYILLALKFWLFPLCPYSGAHQKTS